MFDLMQCGKDFLISFLECQSSPAEFRCPPDDPILFKVFNTGCGQSIIDTTKFQLNADEICFAVLESSLPSASFLPGTTVTWNGCVYEATKAPPYDICPKIIYGIVLCNTGKSS